MSSLIDSLAVLLGRDPVKPKPEDLSAAMQSLHAERKGARDRGQLLEIKKAKDDRAEGPQKWRRLRWGSLLAVNLLFVLSYWLTRAFDVQILEGALTGSRFVGFHMADLNSALQVMLAFKAVLINLLIGTITVLIFWWILGGRTFCSWVCPYHLLAEWAETLHVMLVRMRFARNHNFNRKARVWLWLIFAVLAFVTGYTVFETISPTGIVSRALIYGPGLALLWVLLLLLFEVFYSRRAWCRYLCPIGLTYGLVGATSPLRVVHDLADCHHDGACRKVCLVPHVLHSTKKGMALADKVDIGADCTRCGLCIDACPTDALKFKFKGGALF